MIFQEIFNLRPFLFFSFQSKGKRPRKYGKGGLARAKAGKEKIGRAKKIKSTLRGKFNRIKKEAHERKKKEKELLRQHIRAKQVAAQLTLLARELQTVTKNIQRLHQETKF